MAARWAAESIHEAPPETIDAPWRTKSRTKRAVTSLPYGEAFLDQTTDIESPDSGKLQRTYKRNGRLGIAKNAWGYSGSVSSTTRAQTDSAREFAEAARSPAKASAIRLARSGGTPAETRKRETSEPESPENVSDFDAFEKRRSSRWVAPAACSRTNVDLGMGVREEPVERKESVFVHSDFDARNAWPNGLAHLLCISDRTRKETAYRYGYSK